MQSKALFTALFVLAASSVTEAQDSTNDALTTAPSSFDPDAQLVSIVNASLNSYQATVTTDPKYIAINEYLSSAPTSIVTEFDKENDAYFGSFPATGSVDLPAHITALPSSLQSYASKVLQDEGNIIDEVVSANVGGGSSATGKSPSATGKTRTSNDTQTGSSSNTSGAGPDNTSGASGSSTTQAPTGSGSSASPSSSSSATGNYAEAQPTAALKVMGALAVGVIGLVAVA